MYAIKCGAWVRARIALLVLPMLFAVCASAQSGLVISQVYGGGGNSGAPYSYDFIELYNPTSSPISLNGLSVQYAAATGTSWTNVTVLPNVSVAPSHYFLIQEAEGTTVTNKPLPTPDATGNTNLSATAGKVALVNGTIAIASGTSCPTGTTIIDFVGFGSTANCFEGSGPTPAPSNTTSVTRTNNADTNSNAADFTAGAPNPRNSSLAVRAPQRNGRRESVHRNLRGNDSAYGDGHARNGKHRNRGDSGSFRHRRICDAGLL